MPMWLTMQREIEAENMRRSGNKHQLGHIRNFAVVPICAFTRKFVELDSHEIYDLLNKGGALPRVYSKSVKGRIIKVKEFNLNPESHWNLLFDMDKIRKLARNKHTFRFHMLTDGVSVSLHYNKPNREPLTSQIDIIRQQFEEGRVDNEIGIDPNMHTWMAVVRRDRMGNEVNT